MFNANSTYAPPSETVSIGTIYPKGVAVPLGLTPVKFAPPQRGEKFIAADNFKGKAKAQTPDSRVVTAKENNSAASSPRLVLA